MNDKKELVFSKFERTTLKTFKYFINVGKFTKNNILPQTRFWIGWRKRGGGGELTFKTNLCRYVDLLISYLSCVVSRVNFISR